MQRRRRTIGIAVVAVLLVGGYLAYGAISSQVNLVGMLARGTAANVSVPEGLLEEAQLPNTSDVLSVRVAGEPNAYQFSVEVASPDTGCDQYADWWEVVSEEGELLYRRTLLHSHIDEQPFTRSGGPVPIGPDAVVIVRAHMYPGGYGGRAMRGSVADGFEAWEAAADFAPELEKAPPQPPACAF